MKNIYIHVGLSKCGSSALQSWFSKNHNLLSKQNIYYPDLQPAAKRGKITSGNGMPLFLACKEGNPNKIRDILKSTYSSTLVP